MRDAVISLAGCDETRGLKVVSKASNATGRQNCFDNRRRQGLGQRVSLSYWHERGADIAVCDINLDGAHADGR